jgi:hypothetical protein
MRPHNGGHHVFSLGRGLAELGEMGSEAKLGEDRGGAWECWPKAKSHRLLRMRPGLRAISNPWLQRGHSVFFSPRRSRRNSGSSTLFFLARGHRMVDAVCSLKSQSEELEIGYASWAGGRASVLERFKRAKRKGQDLSLRLKPWR